MADDTPYPPIGDYALIADSNSTALVSRAGSIDWCCIQRMDSGSCFGRLLDWEKGGFCSIAPKGGANTIFRRYLDATLVLQTTFETDGGEARLIDCYALPAEPEEYPYRQILRIIEGVSGHVELEIEIAPRFDYGAVAPWLRQEGVGLYSAIGGNDGLLVSGDLGFAFGQAYPEGDGRRSPRRAGAALHPVRTPREARLRPPKSRTPTRWTAASMSR